MAKKKVVIVKGAKTPALKTDVSTLDLSTCTKDDIPRLLKKVLSNIATIKGDFPDKKATENALTGFDKIVNINSLSELNKAICMVKGKAAAYNKSKAEQETKLGIKIPAFTQNDHTEQQWLDDIDHQMVMVSKKDRLETLNKMKDLLEQNLSKDAKFTNDMQKFQDLLSGKE